MAVVEYPASKLPYPIRDGFGQSFSNPFNRPKMDDGQHRVMRVFDSQPERITLRWKLNWEQLAFLEAWIEYDLDGGANKFTMQISPVLPVEEYRATEEFKYSFDEGMGIWFASVSVERKVRKPAIRPINYFPAWPDGLPEPEKSGYQFSIPDQVVRGNIQAGERDARRRFTDRVVSYKAKWVLDFDQYLLFQNFLLDEIAGGNASFSAPF